MSKRRPRRKEGAVNLFADRLKNLGDETAFKIGDDIRRCEAEGLHVIKLNLGEPDFDSASNINQVAIDNILDGNSHYTDPQGILPLRQKIAEVIQETRGVSVSPDQVVVTSGGKPSIGYSMLNYVNTGEEVIYPSPGFPIYESWINFVKATPIPLQLREEKGYRFEAADLEPLITLKTKLLIINSPSNPTGGVLSKDNLNDIATLIKEKADPTIRILSDEVYDEIVFDGRKHESIISHPGMTKHTILLNSFSKSFAMTGWRLGYGVLPTVEEAKFFRQWNINTYSCTSPFIQEAGLAALSNEENKAIVSNMCKAFEERRDVVIEAINQIEGVTCCKPGGAFYAFPNIGQVCRKLGIMEIYDHLPPDKRRETSPSTLFQLFALYKHGVATLDRRSFGLKGAEGQHFLRISMASDLDSLKEGIKRIEAASRDEAGFGKFIKEVKMV